MNESEVPKLDNRTNLLQLKYEKIWSKINTKIKICYLHHYIGLHLPDAEFKFISLYEEERSFKWSDKNLPKSLSLEYHYPDCLFDIEPMKNNLHYFVSVMDKIKEPSNYTGGFLNEYKTLKLNHLSEDVELDLKNTHYNTTEEITKTLTHNLQSIYKKTFLPFDYINSIQKCQLALIIAKQKAKMLMTKQLFQFNDNKIKHLNYISRNIDITIKHSIQKPTSNILIQTKVLLNLLPLNDAEKTSLSTDIKNTCQKETPNRKIENWIDKNNKNLQWATRYIYTRTNSNTIKKIIENSGLLNTDKTEKAHKNMIRFILIHNNTFDKSFDFAKLNNAANTKNRRDGLNVKLKNESILTILKIAKRKNKSPNETIEDIIKDSNVKYIFKPRTGPMFPKKNNKPKKDIEQKEFKSRKRRKLRKSILINIRKRLLK